MLLLGDEAESERIVEQTWALLRKDRISGTGSRNDYKHPICTTVESLSRTQTLLKQTKAARPRITVGDVVWETNGTRQGVLENDDGTSKPYKVRWDDDTLSRWLYPKDIMSNSLSLLNLLLILLLLLPILAATISGEDRVE